MSTTEFAAIRTINYNTSVLENSNKSYCGFNVFTEEQELQYLRAEESFNSESEESDDDYTDEDFDNEKIYLEKQADDFMEYYRNPSNWIKVNFKESNKPNDNTIMIAAHGQLYSQCDLPENFMKAEKSLQIKKNKLSDIGIMYHEEPIVAYLIKSNSTEIYDVYEIYVNDETLVDHVIRIFTN